MKTETAIQILAATDSNPHLAEKRARRRLFQVRAYLEHDKNKLIALGLISSDSLVRLVRAMRNAGLSPITTPGELAEIAEALGVGPGDIDKLARLMWLLNGSHYRSLERAKRGKLRLLRQADALLSSKAPMVDAFLWASDSSPGPSSALC